MKWVKRTHAVLSSGRAVVESYNGYEFEQVLGNGKGQGSLVCCSLWGHKESDMTE